MAMREWFGAPDIDFKKYFEDFADECKRIEALFKQSDAGNLDAKTQLIDLELEPTDAYKLVKWSRDSNLKISDSPHPTSGISVGGVKFDDV